MASRAASIVQSMQS